MVWASSWSFASINPRRLPAFRFGRALVAGDTGELIEFRQQAAAGGIVSQ